MTTVIKVQTSKVVVTPVKITHGAKGDPASNIITSVNSKTGAVVLDKTDIGLSNVDNTSDADKPISIAEQTALNGKSDVGHGHTGIYEPANSNIQSHIASTSNPHSVTAAQAGAMSTSHAANVITGLGTSGTSTVVAREDDSRFTDSRTPVEHEHAESDITNLVADLASKEPANSNIQTHISTTSGNPHNVTKSDVGLSNADNTSDSNKPISTAMQTALNGKSDTTHGHAYSDITSKPDIIASFDDLVMTGNGGRAVQVNSGGTALELVTPSGGSGSINAISEAAFIKPTVAGFDTTRTITGASISDVTNGIRILGLGTSSNSNSWIYAMKNISAGSAGWRATARIRRHTPLAPWGMTGMGVRNSSDGKIVAISLGNDNVFGFNRNTFSSDTVWVSVSGVAPYQELDFWMRIVDNLTTRKWYISRYGDFWQQIYSESHAEYVTPNQVGVMINPNFGAVSGGTNFQNIDTGMDVYSFLFESLS